MGEIFAQTMVVPLSLGSHYGDSLFLCKTIERLKRLPMTSDLYDMTGPTQRQSLSAYLHNRAQKPHQVQWKRVLEDSTDLRRLRQSIERLGDRQYWNRAWIVQEVALARQPELLCGAHIIEWESLADLIEVMRRLSLKTLLLSNSAFSKVSNFRRLATGGLSSTLKDLSEFKCSDVRDRIYASLRVVPWPESVPTIVPDYTKSAFELAVEVLERCERPGLEWEQDLHELFRFARCVLDVLELNSNDSHISSLILESRLRAESFPTLLSLQKIL